MVQKSMSFIFPHFLRLGAQLQRDDRGLRRITLGQVFGATFKSPLGRPIAHVGKPGLTYDYGFLLRQKLAGSGLSL